MPFDWESYEAIQALGILKMNDALERPFPTQDIFTQIALMMPPVFYMSLIGAVVLDILLFKRWKNRARSRHPYSH